MIIKFFEFIKIKQTQFVRIKPELNLTILEMNFIEFHKINDGSILIDFISFIEFDLCFILYFK